VSESKSMNRWIKIVAIIVALVIVVFTSLGVGILIGSTGFGIFAGSPTSEGEPDEFGVF
jgi:hypothetical protein